MSESSPPTDRRHPSSIAAMVLAVGFVGVLLYVGRSAFVPIALSILFALLLSGPVEALHRRRLPRTVSAAMILICFVAIVGGLINLMWTPAQSWLAAAPQTTQTIQRKIGPAAKFLDRLNTLSTRASHLVDAKQTGDSASATPVEAPSQNKFEQTQQAMVGGFTVIILTLFLLAAGPSVWARMSASFAANVQATQVVKVIEAIRAELGRYYATIALINLGLGTATALAMAALGMPNPMLWGVLAAVFNFIPYVGSALTFAILLIVAFVSFDGIGYVLAVGGSYLALATLEGQVVQPLLVGNRLDLNPIIVFLALWFAGWFWGIAGIAMAIPSLVAIKVAAEHHPRGEPLLQFLSPSGTKVIKTPKLATNRKRTSLPSAARAVR